MFRPIGHHQVIFERYRQICVYQCDPIFLRWNIKIIFLRPYIAKCGVLNSIFLFFFTLCSDSRFCISCLVDLAVLFHFLIHYRALSNIHCYFVKHNNDVISCFCDYYLLFICGNDPELFLEVLACTYFRVLSRWCFFLHWFSFSIFCGLFPGYWFKFISWCLVLYCWRIPLYFWFYCFVSVLLDFAFSGRSVLRVCYGEIPILTDRVSYACVVRCSWF
jgi:hypothetical protein